jgi:Protein of unknown function (DUF3237)
VAQIVKSKIFDLCLLERRTKRVFNVLDRFTLLLALHMRETYLVDVSYPDQTRKRKDFSAGPVWDESVDPATYYFRTTLRFVTAHPAYAFLNRIVAVATGDRRPEGPIYTVHEVL